MKILESYSTIAKSLLIEADDRFVHIGYGKYKEKGKEKDPDAQIFQKTDSGKFEPADGDKGGEEEPKGGEEKPKGGGMGAGDFERDFDDSEPEDKPFGGDTGRDADFQGEPPEGAREPDDVDDDEPEGGEWEFTDDTNLWDPNGPEDREEIMKALLKDPEISAKLGDEPYWDDVDLVPDDDEGETAATLEPGMTFGDMKKQILGKKSESITINGQKYRPIKESKKHILKENYERLFRSLK